MFDGLTVFLLLFGYFAWICLMCLILLPESGEDK